MAQFPSTTSASGVWSLKKQKRAQQGVNWPTVADPYFDYVTLLLHGDGTNGGQNNTFVDSSTNNFTITRNGNTTQGSFSPYGDLWSNYFDGTGDWLSSSGVNIGANDVTIEFWFYATDGTVKYRCLYDSRSAVATNTGFGIFQYGRVIQIYGNGLKGSTASNAFNANEWVHFAVVRNSGVCQIYINGVASGSSFTYSNSLTSTVRYIGNSVDTVVGEISIGYLSNVREVTSAVYTSNFTPPTAPLTAITNTSLLTCQSNRFRDNSSNNFTITRNGDVSAQRFSPFAPSAAYSTATIGGSGYFDGTGDTLTTAATTAFDFGNNNFTIEAWIYPTSFSTSVGICANQDNGTSSTLDGWVFGVTTGGQLYFSDYTNGAAVFEVVSLAGVIKLNQWQHVVAEKRGTGTNQVQLFVDGVAVASGTRNANIPVSTSNQPFTVGNWRYSTDTNREFTGYMTDLWIANTAVYNGTVTPPTAPLTAITNTSLLLNFENAAIFDSAMMADLETVGNAQISTSVKKYGTGSLAFDGSGDYLNLPNDADLNVASGDFTVECWFYTNNAASIQTLFWLGGNTASISTLRLGVDSGAIYFYMGANSSTWGINSGAIGSVSSNTWYHIAVTRSGTSLRVFLDGTQIGSYTSSATFYVGPGYYLGALNYNDSGFPIYRVLNGYMDEVRITKGVARYTGNFVPPAIAFQDF